MGNTRLVWGIKKTRNIQCIGGVVQILLGSARLVGVIGRGVPVGGEGQVELGREGLLPVKVGDEGGVKGKVLEVLPSFVPTGNFTAKQCLLS